MADIKFALKNLGACLLVTSIPLWVLGMMFIFFTANACHTEILQTATNLSGLDFEMTEIACDTLVKDASVNIFVSKANSRRKTLIFKYDPIFSSVDDKYITPSIDIDGHTIMIDIPKLYSIFLQEKQWNDYAIAYKIDYIEYP